MLSDVETAVSTDYDEFYYKLPRSTLQYVLQLELFIALMTRPRPSQWARSFDRTVLLRIEFFLLRVLSRVSK